ncbi:uncharacterized protein [Aegilops tauschii subsp. strangulata]|uniref:uncharacterized protein isoform X2 n=1 Tax=Aegilops tauschii subsp. strangulata TaxID=200361 RepID=UPI00098B591E|nr:uncharacterized protein LOC109741746 isoform X2 [Aegilops tauschii subsp. strangulata]
MASDVAADEPPAISNIHEVCAADELPGIATVQKLCAADKPPAICTVHELCAGDAPPPSAGSPICAPRTQTSWRRSEPINPCPMKTATSTSILWVGFQKKELKEDSENSPWCLFCGLASQSILLYYQWWHLVDKG